jgi:uncharacterized membrane protein YkgB
MSSIPTSPSIARLASSIAAERVDRLGGAILRYGLVAMLLFFGAFKFTAAEANGIRGLIAHSPLLAWSYSVGSVQAVSNVVGIIEISIALLIAARRLSPVACAIGSAGAAALFATTLSFLFTTPGVWISVPGFPVPVTDGTGAFLIKDLFLLGAALWSCADSLHALSTPRIEQVGVLAAMVKE